MSDETEELLQLYADGELTGEAARTFEARLARDPALAAEVAAIRAQSARLRAAVPEPSPERLSRLMAAAGRHRPAPLRQLAAALALLALGGAGGFALARTGAGAPDGAELVADAADAHALYAVEVMHPVEVPAQQRDHLGQWLSNRLGAEISAPVLDAQGYDLVGGRLLPFEAQGAAQFMYQSADGERVTLYAVTASHPAQSSFRFREAEGLTAVTWQEGIWRYALVGAPDRAEMARLARYIHGERL